MIVLYITCKFVRKYMYIDCIDTGYAVLCVCGRVCGVDNLMYIKEDLIIPQHYSFYDFIINKARGKSGRWRGGGVRV